MATRVVILFTSLICMNLSFGALTSRTLSDLSSLEQEVKRERGNIASLKQRVDDIAFSLSKNTSRYERALEICSNLENQHQIVESNLKKQEAELSAALLETKTELAKLLLLSIDGSDGPSLLLERKIRKKSFEQRIAQIQMEQKENAALQLQASEIALRLNEYKEVERDLFSTITNLQKEKSDLSETLSRKSVAMESMSQSYLEKLKESRTTKQVKVSPTLPSVLSSMPKISKVFSSPLNGHSALEYKTKGITLKFSGVAPVLASQDGKVVYLGNLASYGQVLMLDHGDGIRSVTLGDFTPRVEEGTTVKRGSVIGHTKELDGLTGKIYFEVRRQNVVQNTYALLDKKSL